MGNPRF